jgi:hypothetical protein
MLWAMSPPDFRICCLKICEPPQCLHVNIFVNPGITVDIVRACHDNETITTGNEVNFFLPLIYLWVN